MGNRSLFGPLVGILRVEIAEQRDKTALPDFREDDPAFAMAGLWDVWEGDDETISCVTILTTEPNDLMNSIHDRMPVVLPQGTESDWLAADSDTRKELCQPYPRDDLDAYEISTRVNNPGNDDPQVIDPLNHE